MKNDLRNTILLLFMSLVVVGSASAQEVVVENDTGVGVRAMGMGSAHIAAANDLSALIYNPAALARIRDMEVQFGLNLLKRRIETTQRSSRGTGTAKETTDYSGMGTIGLAYPVPTEVGSLVFGIAYNRVKDFAGTTGIDGYNDYLEGMQTGESVEEGGIGVISLGGAVDVSPNVSVGASFDIWTGDYSRDNRNLLNDFDDPYSQLDVTGADDDISAWSFKPSILYFTEGFRFGAYARLPMTFHIDESYYSEGYSRADGGYFTLYEYIDPTSEFTDDEVTYTDKLSYKIKAPMQIGFGVALGHEGDGLAVDIVYENWKQAKLKYPSNYIPEPNYFRDRYRSSLSWKLGAEKTLPLANVIGRVGYFRQPLLFKGPRGYDAGAARIDVSDNRDFLTLGLGKQFDPSLRLDVAYIRGVWSQKESPRQDEETRNQVFVSMTYRWNMSE